MKHRKKVEQIITERCAGLEISILPLLTTATMTPLLIGAKGDLVFGPLIFGERYRALRSFRANASGQVVEGEILRFLGIYVFPYDNGLRLYFEDTNAVKRNIEFEGNRTDNGDALRYMTEPEASQYFASADISLDERGQILKELADWTYELWIRQDKWQPRR